MPTYQLALTCGDGTLQDFLKSDPADPRYKNVRAIVVDPSCSGSGMVSRLDHFMVRARNHAGLGNLQILGKCDNSVRDIECACARPSRACFGHKTVKADDI